MCFERRINAGGAKSSVAVLQAAVRGRLCSAISANNSPALSAWCNEISCAVSELSDILVDKLRRLSRCRGQYACTERIQNHRYAAILSILGRSHDIRYCETIVADQIDEQRVAVIAAPKRASDQIVSELYERLVYCFRSEGQRVEIVQVKVSCKDEGESITLLGGDEGYASGTSTDSSSARPRSRCS